MTDWGSVEEIIAFAIGEEEGAVRFYTDLAKRASNKAMRTALLEFAAEEASHKTKLERFRTGIAALTIDEEIPDLKIADYIVDVTPGPEMTYEDALIVAMKKEKSAYRLYSDLAQMVSDPEAKAVLQGLAQEEARHKLRFEVEYDESIEEN